jgi:ketose-bisphosphate aldolase
MSLQSAMELINRAKSGGYAVGYFESWNLESLQGVIDAAEDTRSPVLIGFNGEFLSATERRANERLRWYAALGLAAAESAAVPCGVIFNECSRDNWVRNAIDAGFSQVMMDDPRSAPDAFARRVATLTAYAHSRGVAMEAEIGHLPCGANGVVDDKTGRLTDPENAARFIQETGIDILAVSVGNVHVMLDGSKPLKLDNLAAIHERIDLPLDLHGGTGIPGDCLREAIRLGVAKVCFGTYMKQRYLDAIRNALAIDEPNPHKRLGCGGAEDLLVAGRLAVKGAVLERIGLLGCCGRA